MLSTFTKASIFLVSLYLELKFNVVQAGVP